MRVEIKTIRFENLKNTTQQNKQVFNYDSFNYNNIRPIIILIFVFIVLLKLMLRS